MNTRGYGGKKLKKSITLSTDDPKRAIFPLSIEGMVPQIATISPKTVRLAGGIGQTIEANVTIIPKKETPFSITEAKAKDGKNIQVKLEELKEEGGKGYVLTVKNIKKDEGRYRDTIVLKTTSKIRPEIVIGVYGRIKAPQIANISPKRVSLRGKVGEPLKAIVTIEPMEKYPFEILGIKADTGKHIRFDLEKLEEAKKTKYVLTIENQKKEKGVYRDTIRLKTSSKIQPEIQIGIFARIVDPQDMQGDSGNRPHDFKKLFQQLQKRKDGKKKSQDSSNAEPQQGTFTDLLKKRANQ